jgi:hypothetical protein
MRIPLFIGCLLPLAPAAQFEALTIYEGVGHNAWEPAYADARLYEWLLDQRRQPDRE